MNRPLQIIIALCVTGLMPLSAQTPRDFKGEAARLVSMLNRYHYKPPILDNSFSNEILQSLIEQLDPGHLYFDEKDIESLSHFKNSIDEEWKGGQWDFLSQLIATYGNALRRGETYLSAEITQNISLQTSESFIPEGRKAGWSKNEIEQKKRWRLWVKYKVLTGIRDTQAKDSATSLNGLNLVRAREKEIKQRILVVENRRTKRILENPTGFENYIASIYFRSVSSYFDPHSLYLSPPEYEKFQAAMSTQEFVFGIGFNEDQNGNILIEHLNPGGPAWKSGELHKGDMLIELKWQGQSTYDLVGIGLDEFVDLLDRGNPSAVDLTIRQSNGLRKTVSLQKEKINTEENTVKGFVLSGAKKIGYISLPGFYTQWDSDEASSCANDMAAEIIKLKGESIEGLILDIRSNGGGSLKEAIEMAGIFIDEGPLAMIADKSGRIITIRDFNRGTVYDGPLLILINGQSASASEILAAAIQDYNRGIIVGSASYGKATAQVVFALDSGKNKKRGDPETFGYATITRERIYRVTGKSNQGVGVEPDVKLPDLFDLPAFHEIAYKRAFRPDSVTKKTFFKPLPILPLVSLKKKSAERVEEIAPFKAIALLKEQVVESLRDSSEVELKWKNFLEENAIAELERESATRPSNLFEVSAPEFNKIRMGMDSYLKSVTQTLMKNLREDPYVEEAYRIASDYIKLKKK